MDLEIDGGYGEGGGQIVRSAVTLSCITGKPVRISNIRKNRKKPGLGAQHVSAVRILQRISGADVSGCNIGSTRLEFVPGRIRGVTIDENVGTAGSITLICQAIIPLAISLKEGLDVTIRGGTDVAWSPTSYYTQRVLGEALRRMGIGFGLEILKRGYYPKGGGRARLRVYPSVASPASFARGTVRKAEILCSFSKVSEQMIRDCVLDVERQMGGIETKVRISREDAADSGASLLVYSADGDSVFGLDSLFDKRNGTFGMDMAKFAGFGVDANLADMLVVPAGLAAGKTTLDVERITPHLETNLFVTSEMTGCRYGIGRKSGGYQVIIQGSDPGIK